MFGRSALLTAGGESPYGNWTGNYSDVSLLLRNGVPGPLVPFDESPTPKTITVFGGVRISTAQAKFGGSSVLFDGNDDYIAASPSSAFVFGADFTIEFWIYANALSAVSIWCDTRIGGDSPRGIAIYTNASGNVIVYSGAGAIVSSPAITTGQWQHVAVSRASSTLRLFVNGLLGGAATFSNNLSDGNFVSGKTNESASNYANGHIDDLRITKDIARYVEGTGANAGKMVFAGTNNLALPAAELPANVTDDPSYNSVSLLLRNGTLTLAPFDESPTPKAITVSGGAGISTTTFKYGGSALVAGTSPNFTWGSNRIQVPAGPAFAYGTGDFTVEAWIYPIIATDGIFWGQTVSGTNYFMCQTRADRRPAFIFATSGGGTAVFGPVITLNQWSHVAIVRNAGQVRVYSNGVGGTAVACTQNFSDTTFVPTIGSYTHNAAQVIFSGLIDDLRVTKGVARYTKNFLPPPDQLPNY